MFMNLLDQLNHYRQLNRGQLESRGWSTSGKWRGFSAAAGVSLAMAGAVDADIVYSGVQNLTIQLDPMINTGTANDKRNNAFTYIDVDVNSVNDLRLGARYRMQLPDAMGRQGTERSFNIDFYNGFGMAFTATTPGTGAAMINEVVRPFAPGVNIGPGASFGGLNFSLTGKILLADLFRITFNGVTNPADHNGVYGQWSNGVSAIAGFTLGANNFGWIRLKIDNNLGGDNLLDTLTAVDWAYERTAGVGIAAGAVPEPGSTGLLALLAAGVAGITRTRRIRKERVAAEPSE